MKTLIITLSTVAVMLLSGSSGTVSAQQPAQQQPVEQQQVEQPSQQQQPPVDQQPVEQQPVEQQIEQPPSAQTGQPVAPAANAGVAPVRKIGFRLPNWYTIHNDGTQATNDRIATLQEIGCELSQSDHGDHVDIIYRCPAWRAIPVDSDENSKMWHDWLVENEFDTVMLNPGEGSPLPAVSLRMADWSTIHVNSAEQADSLKMMYEMIGCEVVFENHGDHTDAKVRCVEWMTIGLPNAQSAHLWQDWLSKTGFETQHDHAADGYDAHAGHDHAAGEAHDHAAGEGHDHAAGEGHDHAAGEGHDHNEEGHDHNEEGHDHGEEEHSHDDGGHSHG